MFAFSLPYCLPPPPPAVKWQDLLKNVWNSSASKLERGLARPVSAPSFVRWIPSSGDSQSWPHMLVTRKTEHWWKEEGKGGRGKNERTVGLGFVRLMSTVYYTSYRHMIKNFTFCLFASVKKNWVSNFSLEKRATVSDRNLHYASHLSPSPPPPLPSKASAPVQNYWITVYQ